MDDVCTTIRSPFSFKLYLQRFFNNCCTLQRHYTENSKQIFPGQELHGLNLNFHIHASVSDLYILTIGLPIVLQENMWTDPGII
jgi:hypothetical protein